VWHRAHCAVHSAAEGGPVSRRSDGGDVVRAVQARSEGHVVEGRRRTEAGRQVRGGRRRLSASAYNSQRYA